MLKQTTTNAVNSRMLPNSISSKALFYDGSRTVAAACVLAISIVIAAYGGYRLSFICPLTMSYETPQEIADFEANYIHPDVEKAQQKQKFTEDRLEQEKNDLIKALDSCIVTEQDKRIKAAETMLLDIKTIRDKEATLNKKFVDDQKKIIDRAEPQCRAMTPSI